MHANLAHIDLCRHKFFPSREPDFLPILLIRAAIIAASAVDGMCWSFSNLKGLYLSSSNYKAHSSRPFVQSCSMTGDIDQYICWPDLGLGPDGPINGQLIIDLWAQPPLSHCCSAIWQELALRKKIIGPLTFAARPLLCSHSFASTSELKSNLQIMSHARAGLSKEKFSVVLCKYIHLKASSIARTSWHFPSAPSWGLAH